MDIYLELLCLQLVTVFIVDLSGIVGTVKRVVWRFAHGRAPFQDFRLKPLDCSLCMTFWGTLLYSLFAGAFSMPVFVYCCILAYLTTVAASALAFLRDLLATIVNKLFDLIEK